MQRVLIVENQSLLGAGIEKLLASEPNLHVMGIAPVHEAALLDEINRYQPDVIILDVITRLTNPTKLLAQLQHYPQLKLIIVNGNDNLLQIHHKQQTLITQAADLVTIIQYRDG